MRMRSMIKVGRLVFYAGPCASMAWHSAICLLTILEVYGMAVTLLLINVEYYISMRRGYVELY